MTGFRVVAPLVLVRDEAGKTHHRYFGSVVDFIDSDHASHLLAQGMIATAHIADSVPLDGEIAVDGSDGLVGGGDPTADPPSRPPHIAAKARWVNYAVENGFDRDEAESMSKQALIAVFG